MVKTQFCRFNFFCFIFYAKNIAWTKRLSLVSNFQFLKNLVGNGFFFKFRNDLLEVSLIVNINQTFLGFQTTASCNLNNFSSKSSRKMSDAFSIEFEPKIALASCNSFWIYSINQVNYRHLSIHTCRSIKHSFTKLIWLSLIV